MPSIPRESVRAAGPSLTHPPVDRGPRREVFLPPHRGRLLRALHQGRPEPGQGHRAAQRAGPDGRRLPVGQRPADRRRARQRPDHPRSVQEDQLDVHHAVRPGGHLLARLAARRRDGPPRGGRQPALPVRPHRAAVAAAGDARAGHRAGPAGQADRRRDAPAADDEEPRGVLDRDQPPGERGRPGVPDAAGPALLRRVRRADRAEDEGGRRRARGGLRRLRARGEHHRDHHGQGVLEPWTPMLIAVLAVIVVAMVFDYTNGFHDAANAIATSVSTRALTPRIALGMAAIGNFIGAHFGAEGRQDRRQRPGRPAGRAWPASASSSPACSAPSPGT